MSRVFIIVAFLLSIKSVGQSNLNRFFEEAGVMGCTTVYDLKKDRWIYTDSIAANQGTLPASTFKIINSCIALQEGVIKDENEMIRWDGIPRLLDGVAVEAWNKDNNLISAYKNSTVWFYEALAKRIGREKYADYLNVCYYGNGDLTEQGVNFWTKGSFQITPVNQIQFLKDFYKEQNLPFSSRIYTIMKKLMVSETTIKDSHTLLNTTDYTFIDKTGWVVKDGNDIGWWVGYVETKDNVYFFATRIIKPVTNTNPNFLAARKEITKVILKDIKAI